MQYNLILKCGVFIDADGENTNYEEVIKIARQL
jgi:hypothetical protein